MKEAMMTALTSKVPYRTVEARDADLVAIRDRWADRRWPSIGYFVHGQAYTDIQLLLDEVAMLRATIAHMDAHLVAPSS